MSENMEQWELIELVDEAVATGQITKEMINEYVYEMKVGGRWITDLTAASYHQLALKRGITTEEIKREDMTDGVMYTVTVAQVDEKPSELWQRRIGVSFEPFIVSGKFDRFCYQKALTKATRNAIKQLVDATERFDAMKRLREIPLTVGAKQDALPAPVVADAVPIPVAEAKTEPAAERIHSVEEMESEKVPTVNDAGYYRRYCFALWNEHQPETGSGRIQADFWDNVKAKYGVKTRTTMTFVHWKDCLTFIREILNESLQEETDQ